MESEKSEFPNPKAADLIKDYAESSGFKDVKLTLQPGSAKGDGFLGIVFKVKIEGTKCNKYENFDVIVKSSPIRESVREIIPIREYTLREIFAYTTLFKTYDELQSSVTIEKADIYRFPTYYSHSSEMLNEFLIMEDLNLKSYRIHKPKSVPLDFEHMKVAMETIARFHGLSFVLQHEQPKLFNEYIENIPELVGNNGDPTNTNSFNDYLTRATKEALEALADTPEYPILERYCHNAFENLSKALMPGKCSVICHGDYWKNNILFKYSERNTPIQAIPLDYQILRYCSPLTDIAYLMSTSTSQELRNEKYHEMLEIYYDSLKNYLSYYSLDVKDFLTKDQLYEELKRVGSYGLAIAISLLIFMTADGEEVSDATKVMTEGIGLNKDSSSYKVYKERIYGVLQDCIRYGYLDDLFKSEQYNI